MKKLYVLRHAESPNTLNLSDKERPISKHGIKQANHVASHISFVDTILCSNALRTKMTCDALIATGTQANNIHYSERLYNSSAETIMDEIKSASGESLLVIAHNMGIHVFANSLVKDGKETDINQLALFYYPATLSVFECPIEDWSELQPYQNTLVELVIPDEGSHV